MTEGRIHSPAPERVPHAGSAPVNGITMAYRLWEGPENPRRPPVVLLHGLLQTGFGMANLAAQLSRRGPVLVPDLRGRGDTDRPGDGYDPATMADDVAALMRRLGLEQAVVIGRVHGGVIAYHLAARHPELVRGVVLGDTAPEMSPERSRRAVANIHSLPRQFASHEEAVTFYEQGLGLATARALHDIPYDLKPDESGQLVWRHDLDTIARVEAAASPRDDWELLRALEAPVLVLRGQHGSISPDAARRFRASLRDCHVQTVIGARGDVFLGPGAEQSFGAIQLFLRRLSGRADQGQQLPLPGADPTAAGQLTPGVIERLAAAINARDDAVIRDLFATDGWFALHLPEGKMHTGGAELALEAFWQLVTAYPGGVVSARQQVSTEQRAAAILAVHQPDEPEPLLMVPVFIQIEANQIVRLTAFAERSTD